jgi:hypothetical protein
MDGALGGDQDQTRTTTRSRAPNSLQISTDAEPRLQAVNRQQMAWRAVEVEQLIAEDHPAHFWAEGIMTEHSFHGGLDL